MYWQQAQLTVGYSLRNNIVSGNNANGQGDEIFGAVNVDGNNLLGHSGRNYAQAFSGFTPGASDITATLDLQFKLTRIYSHCW